jgi:hypothetical protein
MPDLFPDTRRKLAGVLGMLGSDYAGERDAAAHLANRIVRGAGVQWDELIAVPAPDPRCKPPPYQPPPRPPSGWRELARRCAAYPEWLSPWERQFVAGLGRWGRLSSKQAATLDRIALKLRSRGREPGPSDAL